MHVNEDESFDKSMWGITRCLEAKAIIYAQRRLLSHRNRLKAYHGILVTAVCNSALKHAPCLYTHKRVHNLRESILFWLTHWLFRDHVTQNALPEGLEWFQCSFFDCFDYLPFSVQVFVIMSCLTFWCHIRRFGGSRFRIVNATRTCVVSCA